MPLNRALLVATACALLAAAAEAQSVRRRALLIGIDDYTASTLPRPARVNPDEHRGWPDLKGAANDVGILKEMLVLVYGFDPGSIVTLTNQQATRAAILQAIEQHLVKPAAKGDVVFYYYAGHGSQVPNPASDEPDRLDESIVPADSRWGALDIRDKELRPLFNRILDRGARLTLILDHCHSGSGFRLPNGAYPRGIRRAHRIVDDTRYGPRPEERGALVLMSAQDFQTAGESSGDDGRMHGSFTWAWIRALRDGAAGESAEETFLRAQARLRYEAPQQAPAMSGSAEARLRPFLGNRIDRRGDRTVVAVERVQPDGTVVLQGGWANGLAVNTALAVVGDKSARLRVTAMLGLGRSAARMETGRTVRSGALLEVVGWAAPPGRPLRVWTPRAARDLQVEKIGVGRNGTVAVDDPTRADYILAGRYHDGSMEYAWVRPLVAKNDRRNSGLPQRTAWARDAARLRKDLLKLRRLHAWHVLESPPDTPAPYRLGLRREKTQEHVRDGTLIGGETYSIVLRSPPSPTRTKLYYYAFVIDSHGRSYLAFPPSGSVENRFPIDDSAPSEVRIGNASTFRILRPYGVDTYFLLATEEPLPNPSILAWDGVRAPKWTRPHTPLEELLLRTITGARGTRPLVTTRWSIERVTFESVPPR